jgi:L-asparaginase II
LAVKDGDLGITFKIEDGDYAAVTPMTIAVLKKLDLLTKDEAAELDKKFPPVLKNHRGEIIGTIEIVF